MLHKALYFYRRVFRRKGIAHEKIAALFAHLVLPTWEKIAGFYTLPDDPVWFRLVLLARSHERDTVAWMRRLIKTGMTVCDVGAHVGYYTVLMARLVGQTGRVIAFEPHPLTARLLRKNIRTYSNVQAVEAALSNVNEIGKLHDSGGDTSTATITIASTLEQPTSILNQGLGRGTRRERVWEVNCYRFDTWAETSGVDKLDFLKLDVEGAEMKVLQGMRRVLRKSPGVNVVMEYAPGVLEKSGVNP